VNGLYTLPILTNFKIKYFFDIDFFLLSIDGTYVLQVLNIISENRVFCYQ